MYFLLPLLFPSLTWNVREKEKILYLTFDDGPTPDITLWVLNELSKYNAAATFFCVGENVKKHPEIYAQIISSGHATGNHTQNHLNGWNVSSDIYIQNVETAAESITSRLFRPPYGRITPALIRLLKQQYKIIMWDVLSYDFDTGKTGEYCARKVIRSSRAGSIIVFHDSIKAEPRLKKALPEVLNHFHKLGYRFESLQA
jgi:peptidoglycan/xylan/chitin deacetylase (PgdA/CDA1 family)